MNFIAKIIQPTVLVLFTAGLFTINAEVSRGEWGEEATAKLMEKRSDEDKLLIAENLIIFGQLSCDNIFVNVNPATKNATVTIDNYKFLIASSKTGQPYYAGSICWDVDKCWIKPSARGGMPKIAKLNIWYKGELKRNHRLLFSSGTCNQIEFEALKPNGKTYRYGDMSWQNMFGESVSPLLPKFFG